MKKKGKIKFIPIFASVSFARIYIASETSVRLVPSLQVVTSSAQQWKEHLSIHFRFIWSPLCELKTQSKRTTCIYKEREKKEHVHVQRSPHCMCVNLWTVIVSLRIYLHWDCIQFIYTTASKSASYLASSSSTCTERCFCSPLHHLNKVIVCIE